MLSPADADVARRDPDLPGLALVLDPDAFAEAIGAPVPLRPIYVRYKPGTSCLVAYRLDGEEAGVQLAATCYRPAARDKLEKARQRPAVPGPWGPGRLVLERPAVAVTFFPNDDELDVLPRLTGDGRGELLRKMFPRRPELWSATLRPLAYKPARRFVAAVCTGDGPRGVLKAYAGPGYTTARGTVQGVRSGRVLRVARRVGRSNRHGLLAWDWLPGRLLSDELAAPDFSPGQVGLVGAALAEVHAQKPRRLVPRTREREVLALAAAADWLATVCPVLGRRARALAGRLAELLRERPEVSRPVHGDFYAKQVLLGDGTVSFLDFDEAGAGDPAHDLGLFLAHLERGALRGTVRAGRVGPVRAALLDGYRAEAGAVPDGVELYTAAGLLQLAPHSFRGREPDWPDRTAARLDRAEAIARELTPAVSTRLGADVPVHDPFGVADDPRMPFLAATLDPTGMTRRLRSGCGAGRLRAVRVARYKPGRRCVIEYDLDADGGPVTVVGKVRAKGADRTADAVLRALRTAGLADGDVCVPEPLGVVEDLRMTLQRKVPGVPVGRLLGDGPGLGRRVAAAAHRVHAAGVPSSRSHTMADELRILGERLTALGTERAEWADRLDRVMVGCERLADRVPATEPCGVHRDFHPGQLLADGGRVYVLDFDLYCLGDPAVDAGNFLGHLTEEAVRSFGGPDGLCGHEAALEEEFLRLAGARRRPAVRAYAALTLARHVSISTQFADRRPFTGRLLELCEERLGRLGVLPRTAAAAVPAPPGEGHTLGDRT
jgi:aminoglycoside phosphotransferase (APT) family kinase protein